MSVTLFYAALLGLMMAILSIRVPIKRAALDAPWGDAGDEVLATRIRAFGNFIEYVPFIVILMALLEYSGFDANWLHGAGITLTVSRIFHAVSLKAGECGTFRKIGRAIGAMGTWLTLLALSASTLLAHFRLF